MSVVVQMAGVARRFAGPPAVDALVDATLTISAGEHVAIMGPSGAGKSTLLNVMGLLDFPTTGTYLLNDQDTATLSDAQRTHLRAHTIGFVFQDFHLLPGRTALENVAAGSLYCGTTARTRQLSARAALEAVGLTHRSDALPATLSGGERQRVAIARAVVNEPSLLLCDEPTGNLDSKTSQQIMRLLAELAKGGVSVVTITHDVGVAGFADRVINIVDGVSHLVTPAVRPSPPPQPSAGGTIAATGPSSPGQVAPAPTTPKGHSQTSRIWPSLIREAIAGLTQNVARTVLTMLGTVIGVAALVATLGLAATAAGQIDASFDAVLATQVVVQDAATPTPGGLVDSLPSQAPQLAMKLNGVEAAGLVAPAPGGNNQIATAQTLTTSPTTLPVYGATDGYFAALSTHWATGAVFTKFEQTQALPVVTLGITAARQLGVTQTGTIVFIDGFTYLVVGIYDQVSARPEMLTSVVIPFQTLQQRYGPPTDLDRATLIVKTRPGAATQVADEVALALRPDNPGLLSVVPPPAPPLMQSVISSSMTLLFTALAGVTLLIGIAAIANTTLVSVMERTGEIGLRRAIGASPGHIVFQFLCETMTAGLLAGLIGTSAGVISVVAVALGLHWTALIAPWVVGIGPVIGTATGLVAGVFPAWKAGHVPPAAALRR